MSLRWRKTFTRSLWIVLAITGVSLFFESDFESARSQTSFLDGYIIAEGTVKSSRGNGMIESKYRYFDRIEGNESSSSEVLHRINTGEVELEFLERRFSILPLLGGYLVILPIVGFWHWSEPRVTGVKE